MEPVRPSEDDCCNSGCNPCILDVYEDQLKKKLPDSRPTTNCISTTSYTAFTLAKIAQHTQHTFLYTFRHSQALDSALIYGPGQHFLLKGCCDGKYFTKAYTPIPFEDDPHSFTILVRLYENGRMSGYLKNLRVDDETLWRGPYGDYTLERDFKFMLFVAQGTGVAPLYAVIDEMVKDDECETFLKLFLCCRSEDDLVLRGHLHELASFWNFTYEVFLSRPGNVRNNYNEVINLFRLTSESLARYFGQVQVAEVRVLVCGSDAFADDIVNMVIERGVLLNQIFKF